MQPEDVNDQTLLAPVGVQRRANEKAVGGRPEGSTGEASVLRILTVGAVLEPTPQPSRKQKFYASDMISELWVIVILILDIAHAQTTNVTCKEDFNWSYNDLRQSPCLVAAFLAQQCSPNTSYNVPALTGGQMYLPPTEQANPCQCSSVYYSLLSACSQCQQSALDSFTTWTGNCPSGNISMETYPMATPNGTHIPPWAFLPLLDGSFDLKAAGKNATGNAYFGQNPGELSTGAIVGLTIGCIIALALFLAALWLYMRMRRVQVQQHVQLDSTQSTTVASDRTAFRYGKIEGPPRKPHGFLARSAPKVVSYRPGLNFDLDKGRRGDLLELSETSKLTKTPPGRSEPSTSTENSAFASKTSFDSRRSGALEHHSEPGISYPISSLFSRAKEVKPQRGEARLDLAEAGHSGRPSPSNSDVGEHYQDHPPRLSGGRRPVLDM